MSEPESAEDPQDLWERLQQETEELAIGCVAQIDAETFCRAIGERDAAIEAKAIERGMQLALLTHYTEAEVRQAVKKFNAATHPFLGPSRDLGEILCRIRDDRTCGTLRQRLQATKTAAENLDDE